MSRHGRKVGDAAGKRVLEVSQADDADCRADAVRLRPHENMLVRHGRTSCAVRGRDVRCRSMSVVAVSRPRHDYHVAGDIR